MKKIFLSSIALIAFSAAIMIFQISCTKTVDAQTPPYTLPPATTTALGGIIVGDGLSVTGNGTLSVNATTGSTQLNKLVFTKEISGVGQEIWTVNYDGTNATKVNIKLPSGVIFDLNLTAAMSPDGKKIFFTAGFAGSKGYVDEGDVYSCNADGSNVTKIVDKGGNLIKLMGAY